MEIELILVAKPIDLDICFEEFIMNWNSQVPHWHYLSDEGISFFKGMRKRKWKKGIYR